MQTRFSAFYFGYFSFARSFPWEQSGRRGAE